MVAYEAMEKRRPTYDLEAIKAVFASVDHLAMTSSALRDAMALGLPEQEIRAMAKRPEWQLQQPAQDAQPASLPAPRKRGR